MMQLSGGKRKGQAIFPKTKQYTENAIQKGTKSKAPQTKQNYFIQIITKENASDRQKGEKS